MLVRSLSPTTDTIFFSNHLLADTNRTHKVWYLVGCLQQHFVCHLCVLLCHCTRPWATPQLIRYRRDQYFQQPHYIYCVPIQLFLH